MSVINLDELIPIYYSNKSEMDSYKKMCDEQNTQIKTGLIALDKEDYSVGNYRAKIITSVRETTNGDKLLNVMKKHNITDVIKTKEYVDMDALEDYLYNNEASAELAADIDDCIDRKEIISLKVTYKKEK